MMTRDQKKNYITEMESQFQNNEAVLVTHYQGLTMSQLDDLRSQMREHGIKFKITKNRITKLALEKTKCKELSSLFTGPTAVAFSDDVKQAVTDAKSGQAEIRNDKDGNIGVSIGKKSFHDDQLLKNYHAILDTLDKEKGNLTLKGDLIKNTFITSSMGVSYKIKIGKVI